MKFSDIEERQWDELKPYLDTCVLPVTGLCGLEAPWEAARGLERLRDALDLIEIPFKGRIVTYPAMHFAEPAGGASIGGLLEHVCRNLKEGGFCFVVLITAKPENELPLPEGAADLILRFPEDELKESAEDAKRRAAERMTLLWSGRQSM